ncbi:MAG: PspA/IM30 family protein, partial [Oscillospiraceae bacterium]|nr:PspA/IM30 family protein [Oscillospiraceae bacterium]
DPEKMVKQIIIDLQKDVRTSTEALGKAMASQRVAECQQEQAVRNSANWESKAKAALAAGDAEMAKKALSYKVKADADVASTAQMLETITTQTEAIRDQVEALKAKLDEAKGRQSMLIARSQMAKTQKNLAQSMGGMDASAALDKFARMEEKIERQEAEASAFAEIAGETGDMKSFEQMETDAKVDAELARLMAEMGAATGADEAAAEGGVL